MLLRAEEAERKIALFRMFGMTDGEIIDGLARRREQEIERYGFSFIPEPPATDKEDSRGPA